MISVVIPTFNSEELLRRNLPKLLELLKKSKLEFEVIVADDASTDGTETLIKSLQTKAHRLQLIRGEKNRGFASNINEGFLKANGEYIFSLKTDVLPEKTDYFKQMVTHFKDPAVFAVSAALKTVENGKEEIRGRGEIFFEKGFFLHRRGKRDGGISSWADGGASVFRREIYLKLGGFDPLYNPFYWEDVDLGYRAWKAGYKIEFEPKAVLNHDLESGAIRRHYKEGEIRTVSQRNQFIFTWKNADLTTLLKYGVWEPYHMTVNLIAGNWWWFKAYAQALLRWPEIIKTRFRQRRLTKYNDEEVLRKICA